MSWSNKTNLDILHEIGTMIRIKRIANKMSQDDLAEKTGISRGTLSSIENAGRSISLEHIIRIFKALGMIEDFETLINRAMLVTINNENELNRERFRKSKPEESDKDSSLSKEWKWKK